MGIIPDTAKRSRKKKVVAVGPGRLEEGKVIPVDVKAGDKYFSGSIRVLKSNSTARSISSCGKMTSSESLKNKEVSHGYERDSL
jgi:hypothetical protein